MALPAPAPGIRRGGQDRSLHGFGLRVQHYAEILQRGVEADLCEALTENFMGRGGRPLAVLERVRRDVPITLHGVSLSIGGTDPLSEPYLAELDELCRRFEPLLVSDHVCFGSVAGHRAYDLWPLPYTEEALEHVAARVRAVQDRLGRRICLENVSSYVEYRHSALSEWEFLSELSERADCLLLLDVNNVYVSARNHGFSETEFVWSLPHERVAQLHLAGHKDCGSHLLDDHGAPVADEVWKLYEVVRQRFGPLPTLVEWDENLPTLAELERECARAAEKELHAIG
jgi:uncharacterized protein (UPF0276 family)